MADLASLDTTPLSDQGTWMDVLHPANGEPVGARLLLAGEDGRTYQRTLQKQQDRFRLRRDKGMVIPADDTLESALEFLAGITLAWQQVALDGADIPLTRENAVKVYRRFPWLREQVLRHTGDRSNYLAEVRENLPHGVAGGFLSDSAAPTEPKTQSNISAA